MNILSGHDDHRDAVTWLDVDDTIRETYGYAKQGVGYGYNKVKGLNALLGIVSTACWTRYAWDPTTTKPR